MFLIDEHKKERTKEKKKVNVPRDINLCDYGSENDCFLPQGIPECELV